MRYHVSSFLFCALQVSREKALTEQASPVDSFVYHINKCFFEHKATPQLMMMLEILQAYLLFYIKAGRKVFEHRVLCQKTGAVYLVFVLFTFWTARSRTDLPTVASSLSPWRGKCRKQTITCRNKCLKEDIIPLGLPRLHPGARGVRSKVHLLQLLQRDARSPPRTTSDTPCFDT